MTTRSLCFQYRVGWCFIEDVELWVETQVFNIYGFRVAVVDVRHRHRGSIWVHLVWKTKKKRKKKDENKMRGENGRHGQCPR